MNDCFDAFGLQIMDCTFDEAINTVMDMTTTGEGGTIAFVNVHSAVTAVRDEKYFSSLSSCTIRFPDGRPIAIVGRAKKGRHAEQVAGPDFFWAFLNRSQRRTNGVRHYFYGGSEEALNGLVSNIAAAFPAVCIAGSHSPPFRTLTSEEKAEDRARIIKSNANVVWIGLGAPKQELWVVENAPNLPNCILLGVGAAFDFYSGLKPRAPAWMRRAGLEWLHRLFSEPGRLWRRYLTTNSLFLWLFAKEILLRRSKQGKS